MIRRRLVVLILVMAPFMSHGADRVAELRTVERNREGVKSLENEDAVAAERGFLGALAEDPFNPIVRLNLGYAYEKQKNSDKALKEYQAVARDPGVNDQLRFIANFNAGNAAAQMKNIDLALAHYQAALDIMPDSKETKHNIELLTQSGGGGGGGGSGKPKEGDPGQDGENPQPNQGDQPKEQKPQFKSENLSKEDVRKILEELKGQEQKIRALEYGDKQGKDSGSPEKDW